MALKVQESRVVKLAYRLLDGNGRVYEERTPENPYEYIHGRGQVVGPVERAIEGRTAGFRAEIHITPQDAYGQYDPKLVAEIPRDQFPKERELSPGMKFNTTGPSGQPITVRVIEVEKDSVTVDGNHPLSGVDLIFDLLILDVREATVDELEVGRIGPKPLAPGSSSFH